MTRAVQERLCRFISMFSGPNLYVVLALIAPILFAIILYPDSFSLSWNEGRGGFIFALAFIVFELLSYEKTVPKIRRLYIVCILSFLTIIYFASLESLGLQELIRSSASANHVVLPESWTWMWDFIVLCSFLASSLLHTLWYKILQNCSCCNNLSSRKRHYPFSGRFFSL